MIYFLKMRANVALNGDIQLAEREVRALFETYSLVGKGDTEKIEKLLPISQNQLLAHTRNDLVIGFIVSNPKVPVCEIINQLSFIQEIWGAKNEAINELYAIQTKKCICLIPFLAMSEFLSYAEKPSIALVRQILSTAVLEVENPKISKLICKANTSTPHVHGLHTYKAKFFPHFVRGLIVSEIEQKNRSQKK
jgi:hypothetical protein